MKDEGTPAKEEQKNEQPKKGVAVRFIARAKLVAVLAVGTLGFSILTPLLSQGIDGKTIDIPPAQAVAALGLSTGTTASDGIFHDVADTNLAPGTNEVSSLTLVQ